MDDREYELTWQLRQALEDADEFWLDIPMAFGRRTCFKPHGNHTVYIYADEFDGLLHLSGTVAVVDDLMDALGLTERIRKAVQDGQ